MTLSLRAVSLLAWVGSILMGRRGRRAATGERERKHRGSRLPLFVNIAAFGLFFTVLFGRASSSDGPGPLLLAAAGALIALSGSAIALKARADLDAAWSFTPMAADQTGLVTTGLYRLIRHPIYLGLSILTLAEAVAFRNCFAVIGAVAVIASFVLRALAEEKLLLQIFGERYNYRNKTEVDDSPYPLRTLLAAQLAAAPDRGSLRSHAAGER